MPTPTVKRFLFERNRSLREEKPNKPTLSKHLQKIYPIGIHKSTSSGSLSSLSQNSNDSLINSPKFNFDRKASMLTRGIDEPCQRREACPVAVDAGKLSSEETREGNLKRCHWITKGSERLVTHFASLSDQAYVLFHDEQWGVPVYDDEDAFARFDANAVAKMGEKEMIEISSNKKLMLAESRVWCIVDNAKCIMKIVKEFGSFSNYIWGYPRNVPLRTPKSEAISKDLLRRGFRFVGPVIVYSFMQAAGMTIDHLMDCFRFSECLALVESSWEEC
ncbi:hypothetical protein ACLOJK_031067 [Asimina triloba]